LTAAELFQPLIPDRALEVLETVVVVFEVKILEGEENSS
jgi:hypothetical protein